MDPFVPEARASLSRQARKLAKTLAKQLGGHASGDTVDLDDLQLRVAWDVVEDSPHAVRSGWPEQVRWLEVTGRRRAPGTLRVHLPGGRRHPDDLTEPLRRLSPVPLPAAYALEADPAARFAAALTPESARALVDFLVDEVEVGYGRVVVRAHAWPGVLYLSSIHRQRTLDDVRAMLDLARALVAA